jgi:hypothetical protein
VRKRLYLVAAVALTGSAIAVSAALGSAAAAAAAPVTAAVKQPPSSGNFGGITYVKSVLNPVTYPPTAVAIGDVTGDGRNDLVVTTETRTNNAATNGTMVAVYPQLANGKLGAPLSIHVPDEAQQVRVAVLWDNHQSEILLPATYRTDVVSYSGGRLSWSSIPVPAIDLTVANFNDNKYADLLTQPDADTGVTQIWTGSAAHKFSLWRTVTFPDSSEVATSFYGQTVFGADFAHLGRPAVAVMTATGFAVRLQTAPGVFGPAVNYKIGPYDGTSFPPFGMIVGDVTGDGYPDVVLSNGTNSPFSAVEVFPSAHNGGFKSPAAYPALDLATTMALSDLTGNGRDDVIVNHTSWSNIGVLLQNTNGTLASEWLHGAPVYDYDPPAVGDLNGDGRPDIAFTAESRGIGIMYQSK